MRKIAVFIVFVFLINCCILSFSCEADFTANGKDELNVDLIYPYSDIYLEKRTHISNVKTFNEMNTSPLVTGLSSHQWPQQGFNCQHVGRSQYSTVENPGIEKWRYPSDDWSDGSPIIDTNGTIYYGEDTICMQSITMEH